MVSALVRLYNMFLAQLRPQVHFCARQSTDFVMVGGIVEHGAAGSNAVQN
jgi:hypothetical protein